MTRWPDQALWKLSRPIATISNIWTQQINEAGDANGARQVDARQKTTMDVQAEAKGRHCARRGGEGGSLRTIRKGAAAGTAWGASISSVSTLLPWQKKRSAFRASTARIFSEGTMSAATEEDPVGYGTSDRSPRERFGMSWARSAQRIETCAAGDEIPTVTSPRRKTNAVCDAEGGGGMSFTVLESPPKAGGRSDPLTQAAKAGTGVIGLAQPPPSAWRERNSTNPRPSNKRDGGLASADEFGGGEVKGVKGFATGKNQR